MNTYKTFRQKLEDVAWIVETTKSRCSWVREEYENNTKNPHSPHIDPVIQYTEVFRLFLKKKYFGWLVNVLLFACAIATTVVVNILGLKFLPKTDATGLLMFVICASIFLIVLVVMTMFSKFWDEYLELFIQSRWTTHEFPDDFEKFREIRIGYWYAHEQGVRYPKDFQVPDHVRTECKEYLVDCAKKVKESEIEGTTNHSSFASIANAKYRFNVYFQVFRRLHGIPRDLYEKYYYDIAVEQIRADAEKALRATSPGGNLVKV